LRKLLTGALAATITLAGGGAATVHAQTDGVAFSTKVSPADAGTKRKPKNTALNFNMAVDRPGTTVEFIDLTLPKGLKLSGKGLGNCTPDKLEFEGPEACADDRAGPQGTASASLGAQGAPLSFTIDPFVQNAKTMLFFVESTIGLDVEAPLTGKITAGGRKLRISIPLALRQPVPGVDASLTGLNQTFNVKKGKRYLVRSTGCKGGKHRFGAKLTFTPRADNAPVPAPVSARTTSNCSK
jgi:hypothetical protein